MIESLLPIDLLSSEVLLRRVLRQSPSPAGSLLKVKLSVPASAGARGGLRAAVLEGALSEAVAVPAGIFP